MTLHKQRVVLNSPYGKLTHHFKVYHNGDRGTLLRQDGGFGSYIIKFDSGDSEVKVPSHWLEWVGDAET